MNRHVIVGAGPVGSATAVALAEAGHDVVIVSRSGRGPEHPGVERRAADATDGDALGRLARGAAAVYNCANPRHYHRWPEEWPPLAAALLTAAERSGAVLVITSNLYGYGPVDGPMTEDLPLLAAGVKGRIRAGMWAEALTAVASGRIPAVTEARASDYYGPELTATSHLGERVVPRVLAGQTVRVLGDPEVPHSWTYVPDVARALVVLGTDPRAWGRAWHVPTAPPRSMHQMVDAVAGAAGVPPVAVKSIPDGVMRAAGLVWPLARALRETRYQFARPFVLDSTAFTRYFGLEPTPIDVALAATVAWWQSRVIGPAAAAA